MDGTAQRNIYYGGDYYKPPSKKQLQSQGYESDEFTRFKDELIAMRRGQNQQNQPSGEYIYIYKGMANLRTNQSF